MENQQPKAETSHRSVPTPEAPERRRAVDFISVYANQAQVTSSPFDLRLTFSDMQPSENGEIFVLERFSVAMSPQHAKALLLILQQNISRWEARFGSIDLDRIINQAAKEKKEEDDSNDEE